MPHKDPAARRAYHREYMRRYVKDPAKRAQRNRVANDRATAIRRWLDAFKIREGCVDCGYKEHHAALHFDHVKGGKEINVCNAKSIAQAKKEIAKCVVRCANCHAAKTFTLYPCKPDIFDATYEPAGSTPPAPGAVPGGVDLERLARWHDAQASMMRSEEAMWLEADDAYAVGSAEEYGKLATFHEQAAATLRAEPVRPVAGPSADTRRLDALEAFVNREGGIVLHNGGVSTHGRLPYPGLGLSNTGRTLRVAIDSSLQSETGAT